MNANVQIKSREIDFKSLIIGFLLATVLFLSLGAYSSSGTQDVSIVGVNTQDTLYVQIQGNGMNADGVVPSEPNK